MRSPDPSATAVPVETSRPWWRRLAPGAAFFLCALFLASLAAADDEPIVRLTADDFQCPDGTETVQVESPDGRFAAWWCELRQDGQVARHGPYLELYDDGSTYRQGIYVGGVQAGLWVRFSRDGRVERSHAIWPGEAGRFIPQPEDVCPAGTRRRRSTAYDHRRHMQSECFRLDDNGDKVLEGPYIEWDEELTTHGPRYVLRSLMTYEDGERHGPHKVFAGPFRHESLVEDELFVDGRPDGESRAFYLDGGLRELRFYRDGRFDGERIAYYPGGRERWRIVYEDGRAVEKSGDLQVAGEECPGDAVPTSTPDGLELRCARRYLHFEEITGPFVRRDESGRVVQSGLYKNGDKVKLWQSGGEQLPSAVDADTLVAEITMMLGEAPFSLPSPPPPAPDPWENAQLQFDNPQDLEAEIARLNALNEERLQAEENPVVNIWFRDRRTQKYPSPKTEIVDGRVRVYGLKPGRYYMRVEYDAVRSNPMQYAGDLTSSSEFDVRLGEVTQAEAPLLYSLHLTEPWDNAEPIPGWEAACGEEELLPRRPRFTWQAPPGEDPDGIEWHAIVRRVGCEPHRKETVFDERTVDTSIELELEPSRRAEAYEFVLIARRGDKAIGELMSFGKKGGHGWSIRFRVR